MRVLLWVGALVLLASVQPASASDPLLPTGIVAYKMVDGHVLLSWSPSATADHYELFRTTGTLTERIYDGPLSAFYDDHAGADVLYTVKVFQRDGSVDSSSVSTDSDGACVNASLRPSVYVSQPDCMAMIPEL